MTGSKGMRAWLTAEDTESPTQASIQNIWMIWRRFAANPLGLLGLMIVAVLIAAAILVPWIAPYSPFEQNLKSALQPPGAIHLFGTDELGRDLFSRVLWGSRITLTIITIVSVIVAPLGLLVGCFAGYYGGWLDIVLMRITELFLSFPSLILALAFVAALAWPDVPDGQPRPWGCRAHVNGGHAGRKAGRDPLRRCLDQRWRDPSLYAQTYRRQRSLWRGAG